MRGKRFVQNILLPLLPPFFHAPRSLSWDNECGDEVPFAVTRINISGVKIETKKLISVLQNLLILIFPIFSIKLMRFFFLQFDNVS